MRNDPVSQWMAAAAKFPVPSREETLLMARAIRAWQDEGKNPRAGQRALNQMVERNLRLVPRVWRQYAAFIDGRHESAVDVLQAGAIGIRTAALKYDHTRGYEFSTVAYLWIRKEMQDWMRRSERTIRVASDCLTIGGMYPHWAAEFENLNGRQPTIQEASIRFKKKPETMRFYLERFTMTRSISLNQMCNGQEDGEIADVVADTEGFNIDEWERHCELRTLVEVIAERAELDVEDVFMAMEWKGAKPKDVKEMSQRIRKVGKHLWKRNKEARKLFLD